MMWSRIPSSSLRVTGADRADFVQGQMTGDLRGAPTPGLVPCAFLNVRGQIEHFARVYKRPDDIYIHLDEGQAAGLLARLRRYIIFDQVELTDTSDTLRTIHLWATPEVSGWDIPGWEAGGPDVQAFQLAGQNVLAGRVNRTGTPGLAVSGLDLHYLAAHEAEILAALPAATEAPLALLDAARIRAGIPDITRDGFVGSLPQEVGLDVGGPLPAISYRKGCYVGQEIMARLEARGNTRFHLMRLEGQDIASHSEIRQNGGQESGQGEKVVGQTGLSVDGVALAKLRKEVQPGAEVRVVGQVARVEALAESPALAVAPAQPAPQAPQNA